VKATREIELVVEAIRRGYDPDKIIIFGSRAVGECQCDSDLDILIIKKTDKPELERIREVSRLLRPRPLGLDILVKTPEEIEQRLAMGDDFIRDVLRRGWVVYERGKE